MDLAHLSTNPLCSLPFTHFTISPSISSVWIHIALPPPLLTDSSKSSPSSPNTKPEPRYQQCCPPVSGLSRPSCASASLQIPDGRQRCANYVVNLCKIHIRENSNWSCQMASIRSHDWSSTFCIQEKRADLSFKLVAELLAAGVAWLCCAILADPGAQGTIDGSEQWSLHSL